jgi:putative membrane protein
MTSMLSTLAVTAGDHWDGDGRPDFWPIFPIAWFLIVVGAIVAAVYFSRRRAVTAGPRAGEARLAERFAASEIDEEEYVARLAVLRRR